MVSLRPFDTYVLSTELLQLLIRKLEDKDLLRTEKFPVRLVFLLLLKLKEPISSSLSHKTLIVTSK